MIDDLVKRLREYRVGCGLHCEAHDAQEPLGECIEAASRIEKLEAALTPFLNLPIGVINDDPPEMQVYQCHGWPRDQLAVVTMADFRRVRKALEGKDGD